MHFPARPVQAPLPVRRRPTWRAVAPLPLAGPRSALVCAAALAGLAGATLLDPAPLAAQPRPAVRPAARRTSPVTRPDTAAMVASLRAPVLRGDWRAARAAGEYGRAAVPLARVALADADPVARRAGAVVAANVGAEAGALCPALTREAAGLLPLAGDGAWTGEQAAWATYEALRTEHPAADVYLAPGRVGCPIEPVLPALAAAAARVLDLRRQAATGAAGSAYAGADADARERATMRATSLLAAVFAGAAEAQLSRAGRAMFTPLAVRALTDTAGLPATARAQALQAVLRFAATTQLYTPELEREAAQQWLAPAPRAFVDATDDPEAAVAYLRQRPDRLVALARAALAAPPAPVEPPTAAGTLPAGPTAPGAGERYAREAVQRRAVDLAVAGGPEGVALLGATMQRDLGAAQAAARAGDPDGGAAGRRLRYAAQALRTAGPAARGAAPALAAVLQADLPPESDLPRVARAALAAVRGQ